VRQWRRADLRVAIALVLRVVRMRYAAKMLSIRM
jgi:hypothetical protein